MRLDAITIQQKATVLRAAEINLSYTNIVSPVAGTVVTRDITAAQTNAETKAGDLQVGDQVVTAQAPAGKAGERSAATIPLLHV